MAKTQSGKPELLFKHKDGTVTVTVYGPRIGFQWTRVEYFRWVKCTKDPSRWERRPPDRETDQIHLEQCVKAVRQWFRARGAEEHSTRATLLDDRSRKSAYFGFAENRIHLPFDWSLSKIQCLTCTGFASDG